MELDTPVVLGLTKIHCNEDTTEWNNDEPYCVMFVVNNRVKGPLPPALVFRSRVFEQSDNMDAGDTRTTWVPIWGVQSPVVPAPAMEANDIIALAALIENDSSDPNAVASTVQATLTASLTAARGASLGRAATVSKLLADMKGAIALGAGSGGIDMDEFLGPCQEITLTDTMLTQARNGHIVQKQLVFESKQEDSKYTASFELRPGLNWKGWTDRGGIVSSSPAVASWAAHRLDVFVKGADDQLWHRRWNDASWNAWTKVLDGNFKGAPAAVSWGPNRIDVFARGLDDHLKHTFYDGSGWSAWQDLGGVLGSAPTVASWAPGRLDVLARGSDGGLWHRAFDGGWKPWGKPLPGVFQGGPTAVSWGPNRVDVFVRGEDDLIGHAWFSGGKWNGWSGMGGPVSSSPSVASWAANRLDLCVRGMDNQLWHTAWTGSTWTPWRLVLGGTFHGPPAAVSWGVDRLDIVVRGDNDHVMHCWWG